MKSIIIDIIGTAADLVQLNASISFQKFADDINSIIPVQSGIGKAFFEDVVANFAATPGFLDNISIDNVGAFEDQLMLVNELITPSIGYGPSLSAMCTPISSTIFFGTDDFYSLITEKTSGRLRCEIVREYGCIVKQQTETVYSFILEQLYGLHLPRSRNLIITMKDDLSGLQKFYSIDSNPRFARVFANGKLPELDLERISEQFRKSRDLSGLTKLLPLSLFCFEGFSLLTLNDVTEEHAIEKLKNTIMNRAQYSSDMYFNHVIDCLKMLCQDDGIDFGMMPFLKINDELLFTDHSTFHSKLVNAANIPDVNEQNYISLAKSHYKSPQMYQDIGVAYALLPAYAGNEVVGVLEVYSLKRDVIDERTLSKLDRALPMIVQVFVNHLKDFEGCIDQVIRQKFTSLQPAVQWRFKEAAATFLKNRLINANVAVMEDIRFKNVYPLYGSIDIRNSTIERNTAIQEDFKRQFTLLIGIFSRLKDSARFELAGEIAFKCTQMMDRVINAPEDSDELRVEEFLESEVHPLLSHLGVNETHQSEEIEDYFSQLESGTGEFCLNRRSLESSIQIITSVVSQLMDSFEGEIQDIYPIYFERFRSDGIEYDIYAGQTITPHKAFNKFYLENIRLKQLMSMAVISKSTHKLFPQMIKKLETTQLIFIYSGSIDISFRDDERRFDVEGAYNVRYQVIKKRIDKVHIKGTSERLTQPGKIAMVYFTSRSIEEYIAYIAYLQQQSILLNDLEFLDLEELQSVNGLKALRVGVNFEG
jgi:hypothetical protein